MMGNLSVIRAAIILTVILGFYCCIIFWFPNAALAQAGEPPQNYCQNGAGVVYGQIKAAATGTPVGARMTMGVWTSANQQGSDGSAWYFFGVSGIYDDLKLAGPIFADDYITACYGSNGQVYWRCEDAPTFSVGPNTCLRVDINLYKKGVLYGTIRDTNGQIPIVPYVQLKSTPDDINQYIQYDGSTGTYTAPALVPREAYKLSVYAQGLQSWYHYDGTTDYAKATPITVGPDERKRLDLIIPAAQTAYSITGFVTDALGQPVAGVTIHDSSGLTTRTDGEGLYSLTNVAPGSHELTASAAGFVFTPATRTVNLPPSASSQNFIATAQGATSTIAGHITDSNGLPLASVGVALSNGASVSTDSNGAYTFSSLPAGTYTVQPNSGSFNFQPSMRSVSVPPNATAIDFTGVEYPKITGRVTNSNGDPLPSVTILSSLGPQATTATNGAYTITNAINGTHLLTPTLDGYTFTPPTRSVAVPPDASNVDFVACGGQELAERYAPIMHYHADELYRPIAVDFALLHSDLVHYQLIDRILLRIVDKSKRITHEDLLKPEFNKVDRWIDLPGDGDDRSRADAYQNLGGGDLPSLAYARIYCPPTPHPKYSAAIQYWFFYYDNPWYLNRHEGDWEMVQVMLDHDQNPIAMGFSTHFTGVKRPWATINKQNTHPFVYVAEGGHGSYSFPARYSASDPTQLEAWWTIGVDDATTAMTPGTPIAVQMIPKRPDRQSWLYFNGHWGSSEDILNDAPLGPRGRIAKHLDGDPSLWDNPIVWFDKLETYEDSHATTQGKIQVSTPSGINITINPQGGANRSTPSHAVNAQDEAIESYVNPETGRRVVIVHQPDTSELYDVTLNAVGTTQPSDQVRLHFPDVTQGAMVAVTYPLPSAWGQNSKAMVTVNQTNDLQLQVDLDGNGVTDQSIAPSNVQTETVGFAQPPTLSIAQSGANIQLTWSNGSTNQRYEIHRSHQPYFTPSAATLYQSFDNTIASYTDAGAAAGNTNFYYLVRAKAGPQAADSNQVGLLRYPLNNQGGKYTLLTLPFSSSTIRNAATLATHIGNVGALLKWNPATQSFRFFSPPSSGDNFPVVPGDAVFVSINTGGPNNVTFVGNVTASQYTLRPGGYNFLSLPHQRADLTNAAAVAADIGGVQALLAWNAATQSFRFFAPPNAGDNFALAPGDALIALLTAGGPTLWPASNGNPE